MAANTQKLGSFLYQRRMKLGITKREIAAKLSVSERTISFWESDGIDSRKPTIDLLFVLADIYEISVDDMPL